MLYAGLRPAEAYGLRWEHVNLAAGLLTVEETRPGGGRRFTDGGADTDVQPPKWRPDGATRMVPAVPQMLQLLQATGPEADRSPPTGEAITTAPRT